MCDGCTGAYACEGVLTIDDTSADRVDYTRFIVEPCRSDRDLISPTSVEDDPVFSRWRRGEISDYCGRLLVVESRHSPKLVKPPCCVGGG